MATLRQHLLAWNNDYTELEERYRAATGTELVVDPFGSFGRGPVALTKSVSVLIGSYNSAASLQRTLISLEASTFNQKYRDRLEVIVVDDGSTDGTREMVRAAGLDLHVVYVRQANAGLTRAHNTGLAFAANDIVVFSDSDMVHTPCAIEELVKRHEILEHVTLVGFRFEIAPDDPRLAPDVLRDTLPALLPEFYLDFRLNFPGKPDNICATTRHFKDFGFGRTVQMANGVGYDLPGLVVGAFFSLRRQDYLSMGASDERLSGWGCEDSIIGARSIGLGNFVIPVYAAASGHLSHPRRTGTEGAEFAANIRTAARILDEQFVRDAGVPLARYRARAVEHLEIRPTGRPAAAGRSTGAYPPWSGTAADHAARGRSDYALSRFDDALAHYDAAIALTPGDTWLLLGRAKTLRELGRHDESLRAFAECLTADTGNIWGHFEHGLTRARLGRYAEAREAVATARRLAPEQFDFGWALDTPSSQHKARGNHHAVQGFHDVAARDFELALIVDEHNCWAHFDRGLSLRADGRLAEAQSSFELADRLLHPQDGNRSWLHAELGVTQRALGRVNAAKVQLETALVLWPDNPTAAAHSGALHEAGERAEGLLCHLPILEHMRSIEGWLSDAEADLLIAATAKAAAAPGAGDLVEIGSYCGKSTVVIGDTLRALGATRRLHAIDPHAAYHFGRHADTYPILMQELERHGLTEHVVVVRARSTDVSWQRPIAMLFIDGLHDYEYVRADYEHFRDYVRPGGLVLFHDYFAYCPGVRRFVDELLLSEEVDFVTQRDRLVACRKREA